MARKKVVKGTISRIIRKFTLLDILLIATAVGILGFLLTKRVTQKTEWVDVRVKLGATEWWWDTQNPDYWFVAQLKKGEKSFSSLGDQVATLKNIEIYDDVNGKKIVYTTLSLVVSYDQNKGLYIYNYQPLQIGKTIDLTFPGGNVRGLILSINAPALQYQIKTIDVVSENVLSEAATSYTPGTVAKDNNGDLVTEIVTARSTDSRVYQTTDINRTTYLIPNLSTGRKDVTLRLKVKAFKAGNEWYFANGEKLRVNEMTNFYFPKTSLLDARIVKIVD